ncbi:hypothetical protein HDV04_005761 [Boothiomyces sp. JEL0838]|nr:hypothetical protein HDV04_005761 [Boothiomyces sp. JEL0838]
MSRKLVQGILVVLYITHLTIDILLALDVMVTIIPNLIYWTQVAHAFRNFYRGTSFIFDLIPIIIVGSVCYGILYYFYSMTNILQSDDAILGLEGVFSLFEQFQVTGTLLLYRYLAFFTEQLVHPSRKIPEKTSQDRTVKM